MMFDWQHEMWQREWMSPRNGDKGRWYLPTVEIFKETVRTLQGEYGVPIVGSPSYIGLQVLRDIHQEQGKKIEPLPMHQKVDFQQYAKQMCNWMSWSEWYLRKPGLSPNNKRKRKIVGYDKNGQFLGSSGSVYLGNGGYVTAENYGPNMIGFWEYELADVSDSLFNGSDLPCPLDRVHGWASIDLLEACRHIGLKFDVLRGIQWKEGEKYLARWAKEMWQHRVNMNKIDDAIIRRNCAGTAKHTPNTMVGRFANESSGEYFHPDWNRAIVHRSVTNLTYTLAKIKRETDLTPILISKDALYFATNIEYPAFAVPYMLEHEHEQRGWKPIGVCDLTDEIIEAFRTGKVGLIEQLIKGYMKIHASLERRDDNGAPASV